MPHQNVRCLAARARVRDSPSPDPEPHPKPKPNPNPSHSPSPTPNQVRCLARLVRRAAQLSAQLSLRPKGKQLLGFYQIATRVSEVYDVPMPAAVARMLAVFEVLNVNIGGVGLPLQCLGLGTYEQQLSTTMLAPLLLAGVLVLGFVVRSFASCCIATGDDTKRTVTRRHRQLANRGSSRLGAGVLAALPWLLTLSFLVFPMVSSAA